jgi:hypothetical protein
VQGKTAKRSTSVEFIAFLSSLVNKARWAREIHIVLNNLSSAHDQSRGNSFWLNTRRFISIFTPTYSSLAPDPACAHIVMIPVPRGMDSKIILRGPEKSSSRMPIHKGLPACDTAGSGER